MLLSLYVINILYSTIHLISIPAQPPLLYTQKIILSIHILKFFCKHFVNIIIFVLIFFFLYIFLCYLSTLSIFHNFSLKIFFKITKNFVKPLDKRENLWYNTIKERQSSLNNKQEDF